MKIYFGWDAYGVLAQRDGSAKATRFFHVMYVPLAPTGGYQISADGQFTEAPLHFPSVLAGYFKTWSLLVLALLLFIGVGSGSWWYTPRYAVTTAVAAIWLLAATAAWLFWGTTPQTRPLKRALGVFIVGAAAIIIGSISQVSDIARSRMISGLSPAADHQIPYEISSVVLSPEKRPTFSRELKDSRGRGQSAEMAVRGGYATVSVDTTFMHWVRVSKGSSASWWVDKKDLVFLTPGSSYAGGTGYGDQWQPSNHMISVPSVSNVSAKLEDNRVLLTPEKQSEDYALVALANSSTDSLDTWKAVHGRMEAKLDGYTLDSESTGPCAGVQGVVRVGTYGKPKKPRTFRWACAFVKDGKEGFIMWAVPMETKATHGPFLEQLASVIR